MSNTRAYVLTSTLMKRYESLGLSLHCFSCGLSLKVNDNIVSKTHGRQGHIKFYHSDCEARLYLDCDL
jgi:hypothetical protein